MHYVSFQVVNIPEELTESHDLTVDYILTPTQVIKTNCQHPKPQGIIWSKVSLSDFVLIFIKYDQRHCITFQPDFNLTTRVSFRLSTMPPSGLQATPHLIRGLTRLFYLCCCMCCFYKSDNHFKSEVTVS